MPPASSHPIAAVLVHVPCPEEALAWYKLALPHAAPSPIPGCIVVDGVMLEIVPSDAKVSSGPSGTVVYWRVADFEAALAHFQGIGAQLYRGPLQIEDGQAMCQVRDPWGNCIGLRGPSSLSRQAHP